MSVLVLSPNGSYTKRPDLATAATDPDAAGKTIHVTSLQVVTTSIVWPADRKLVIDKGGLLTISAGQTLTFADGASFEAGLYQVFAGDGDVIGLKEAYPEWFDVSLFGGAVALQKSLNTRAYKQIWSGSYAPTKMIQIPSNVDIRGDGTIDTSNLIVGTVNPFTLTADANMYPISAPLLIQGKDNVTVETLNFVGGSATSGVLSQNAIYIDYGGVDPLFTVGSTNIRIRHNTFTGISRFGISGQCLGGDTWDISENVFNQVGGALAYHPASSQPGLSTEGVHAAFDIIYDDASGTGTRSFVQNVVISKNQINIDSTTQPYYGNGYKVQGVQNSLITGNIIKQSGSINPIYSGSAAAHFYVIDSLVSDNVTNFSITSTEFITYSLQGCVRSRFANNLADYSVVVTDYVRNTYTTTTLTLDIIGTKTKYITVNDGNDIRIKQCFVSDATTVLDGANVLYESNEIAALYIGGFTAPTTYVDINNITLKNNLIGTLYNWLGLSSTGCSMQGNRINRISNAYTTTKAGRWLLINNTIYSSVLDSYIIYLLNMECLNNTFYGSSSSYGGYITLIYNSTMKGNRYINNGGAYTGAISITTGSTTSVVKETPSSFFDYMDRYTVFNNTGTYQQSTIEPSQGETSFALPSTKTGTWKRGDIVYNSFPTAGGYMGAVCTVAGTPGTWKAYGAILP